MATANCSDDHRFPHSTPHPMANRGYGKRSAPGQLPRSRDDFTHLPRREASVAAYLDRLGENADMSVKTLAKVLPYGQCALRTALNTLQRAGHLRRGREQITATDGGRRWITRSWFSRTARDDDWWARFVRGDVPDAYPRPQPDTEPEQAQVPAPEQGPAPARTGAGPRPHPTHYRALLLLASLGRTAPALTLSQAECANLAPLLDDWFARGATEEGVTHALTGGLPSPVHHPAALVRSRLLAKLPPDPVREEPRTPRRLLECAECGVPGRPEALPGGVCRACRDTPPPPRPRAPLPAPSVHARAAAIRAKMPQRRQERTPA
ncbi:MULTISPECIES: hypothetical protein [Streptomyces]|uniref:hypothetical protein n=1 Tax=Streptomyces TaxID=1883 RepID=UPI0019CDF6A2|nr:MULTISPECIES: hypothetical protein [Streptomyces]MDX3359794.1 hypothetical protein [Streptomyces sp. ME02-6978.2a]GHE34816.1 hypothetical protein GCM10018782_06420 [Streptomyces griseoaurantiacus]